MRWVATCLCGIRERNAGFGVVALTLALTQLALSENDALAADSAPGIYSDRVVFGQSCAMTGDARELGLSYEFGIAAGFGEINAAGGIHGRRFELKTYDDAYESDLAATNVARFVDENDTFAIVGGTGTPTARRIAPYLRTYSIPFVGPFTGADFLHDIDTFPNVVNLRTSYLHETQVLVDELIRSHGLSRLGIIHQDDEFGRSVLRDFKVVLGEYGLPILGKAVFTRNSHAVHASVFQLAKADLDGLLLVGTYASNAELIDLFGQLNEKYIAANLSFVISRELAKRLSDHENRVLVTEVVPNPFDDSMQVTRNFRVAARRLAEERNVDLRINEVALEGYVLGRFLGEVFARLGPNDITRARFLETALSSEHFAIDDWEIQFNEGSNTGSGYVRLVSIANGEVIPVD